MASGRRLDTPDIAQAWRSEAAVAWLVDERRGVTVRETQDLSASMGPRQSVVVHSAEVRHRNAPGLPALYGYSGRIDDLNQNVSLGEMKVSRV